MNDLKQLFGSYNICARFSPGFLFITSIYFLLGYDIKNLKDNSIFVIVLLIILSGVCGFISASISKLAEGVIWHIFKNPIIIYLKIKEKELYNELLNKCKKEKDIIIKIKKCTRGDNKLFWKYIFYGFSRNSILLSMTCLFFSHKTQYFCINFIILISILIITLISSFYYAHQIIESYKEITLEDK